MSWNNKGFNFTPENLTITNIGVGTLSNYFGNKLGATFGGNTSLPGLPGSSKPVGSYFWDLFGNSVGNAPSTALENSTSINNNNEK